MLVKFSVTNFRSFKQQATLSLEAEALRSRNVRVIPTDIGNLLPVVGIYGPNASGKSNVLRALSFLQKAVRNSDALNKPPTSSELLRPFMLDKKSQTEPSAFEVVLLDHRTQAEYTYGFKIDREHVVSEWLLVSMKGSVQRRSRIVFSREGQNFDFNHRYQRELQPLTERVLPVTLALPTFATWAHELSLNVVNLLGKPNLTISHSSSINVQPALRRLRTDTRFKKKVLDIAQKAGLGIQDLVIDEVEIPKDILNAFPVSMKKALKESNGSFDKTLLIFTGHKKYMENGKPLKELVPFELQNDESLGTQQYLALTSTVLEALEHGAICVIDELGANLHPLLTSSIVKLFQDARINKKGAQLIFCSHETYLLSKYNAIRRDQVWLAAKNDAEQSTLVSLAKYKPRNDIELSKHYLDGKFAALPPKDLFENLELDI